MKIVDFIPEGQENAVSMKELAAYLGINPRAVRLLIQKARENGQPICSSCSSGNTGYYLPTSEQEAAIYIRQQKARLKTARKALCGVLNFIKKEKEQDENV